MGTLISGVVLSICVVHVVAQDALTGVLAHARAKRDAGEFRMAAKHLEERFNTVVEPAAVEGWLEAEIDAVLFDQPNARVIAEKALRRLDGLPAAVRASKPVVARRRTLEAAEIWASARGGRRDAIAADLVERGLAHLREALKADDKLAPAHLVSALFHREDASVDRLAWERMEESFRLAVLNAPNDPVVRALRAEQRVREGRFAAAVAEYDELLRRTRDFRPGIVRRFIVGARLDPKDALLKAETLLGRYRDELSVHIFRTRLLIQRPRQDDKGFTVLQYAQATKEVAPFDLDALENLIDAYVLRGRHAEAVNAATDGVFGTNGALRERVLGADALAPMAEGEIPGMDVYRVRSKRLGVEPQTFKAEELERARKPPPELLTAVRRAARRTHDAEPARRFRTTSGGRNPAPRTQPLRPQVVDESAPYANRVGFRNDARAAFRVKLLQTRDERGAWTPVDVGWLELLPRQQWTVMDGGQLLDGEPTPLNASAAIFALRLPDGVIQLWAPCPQGAPLKIEIAEADLVYFAQLIRSQREYAGRMASCAMALPSLFDVAKALFRAVAWLGRTFDGLRDALIYRVARLIAPDIAPETLRKVADFIGRVLDTGFKKAGVVVEGVAALLEYGLEEKWFPEAARPVVELLLEAREAVQGLGLLRKIPA